MGQLCKRWHKITIPSGVDRGFFRDHNAPVESRPLTQVTTPFIQMEQEYPPILCERYPRTDLPPIHPNLLHSNHVPTAAEVSQMLELLEEETKEVNQCEREMAPLRRRLDQIEARKQYLEAHMEQCRSVISAQRKLPVEVWEDIFARSVRSSHLLMAPIILTHVCSRWRVIVTGCPRLWTSMCVNIDDDRGDPSGLVETYFANSGACSLNLEISLWGGQTEESRATWEILTHHISRSERLSLQIDEDLVSTYFQHRHVTFNNLLSFAGDSWNTQTDINNPFWQALREAPKLTEVMLDSSVWPLNSLPYSQLTTLTINNFYVNEVGNLLQVLEVSVNLHYIHLYLGNNRGATIPYRIVDMPSLRTLVVHCHIGVPVNDPSLDVLFSSLVMPGLLTLELSCGGSSSLITHWPASLLTMLRHSSMTLRDMSLSLAPFRPYSDSTWDPLSILLEMVPKLTHFKLDDIAAGSVHQFSDGIQLPSKLLLTELTYVSHKSPILPQLENVSIHGIRPDDDTMNAILTLTASRSPRRLSEVSGVCPLRQLQIVYCQHSPLYILEPRMLEVIEDLKREGVKVVDTNRTGGTFSHSESPKS